MQLNFELNNHLLDWMILSLAESMVVFYFAFMRLDTLHVLSIWSTTYMKYACESPGMKYAWSGFISASVVIGSISNDNCWTCPLIGEPAICICTAFRCSYNWISAMVTEKPLHIRHLGTSPCLLIVYKWNEQCKSNNLVSGLLKEFLSCCRWQHC